MLLYIPVIQIGSRSSSLLCSRLIFTCGSHWQRHHVPGHAVMEEVPVDVSAVSEVQLVPQVDLFLASHPLPRCARLRYERRQFLQSLFTPREGQVVESKGVPTP